MTPAKYQKTSELLNQMEYNGNQNTSQLIDTFGSLVFVNYGTDDTYYQDDESQFLNLDTSSCILRQQNELYLHQNHNCLLNQNLVKNKDQDSVSCESPCNSTSGAAFSLESDELNTVKMIDITV